MNEATYVPDSPASDGSLLRRFRNGSADAATLLYYRYAEQLLSLASARLGADLSPRVDAEDVVQSVFRTFFRRVARGEYEVPDGDDLWKLLLVMALNKIRSAGTHHRAARRDVARTPQPAEGTPTADPPGDDETPLAVLRLAVEEVLGRLSPGHRLIIEKRIDGHEVAEIAALAGRSVRSTERVLCEFRRELAAVLGVEVT